MCSPIGGLGGKVSEGVTKSPRGGQGSRPHMKVDLKPAVDL